MKRFMFLLLSFIVLMSIFTISIATNDGTTYYYLNDSGEFVGNDEFKYDDENTILVDNPDELDNLYSDNNQEYLKKAFESQSIPEVDEYEEVEDDEELIITEVLSDIKSYYLEDNYYYYVIQYQTVKLKDSYDEEISAVVVMSYDITLNKNLKPLKAGDKINGFIELISKDDELYNMVDHGLKDDEIAYVSITTQERGLGVILLSVFAMLLLLLYAGKNGAKLLIPIFVALDLLFIVFVPELEIGKNMILLSSLIALELIVLITVLKNGWSRKTTVALISSLIVVSLVTTLGLLFGNSNGFTGKGLISSNNYSTLENSYYLDKLFKNTVGTYDLYLSFIILVTSVISAVVASKLTIFSEKYAGTNGMINSIIEESKEVIGEYPLIIAMLSFAYYLPNFMIYSYNHYSFKYIVNSESFVINLTLGLLSIIALLITSPIVAIVSYLFMGKVEIKQISSNE